MNTVIISLNEYLILKENYETLKKYVTENSNILTIYHGSTLGWTQYIDITKDEYLKKITTELDKAKAELIELKKEKKKNIKSNWFFNKSRLTIG